jgi:Ni,Fe-hydrogenase I small subunit
VLAWYVPKVAGSLTVASAFGATDGPVIVLEGVPDADLVADGATDWLEVAGADVAVLADGKAAGSGGAVCAQPARRTAATAALVTARRIALLDGCPPIVPPRSATTREDPAA